MLELILKYMGLDPATVKDEKTFIEEFNKNFYNKKSFENQKSEEFRELYPKMIGKFAGENTTKIKTFLKKNKMNDILTDDEIKDKDFEEVLDLAMSKMHGSFDAQIKKLQEEGGKNSDEKIKALQTEKEQLTNKISSLEEGLNATKSTLEEKEKTFDAEKKNWGLNSKKSELYTGIKYKEGATNIEKKGFVSAIEEALDFHFDEKNNFVVTDKATKKLIPGKKSGEFLSPAEAIENLGVKEGVWAVNPHSTEQKKKGFQANKSTFNQGDGKNGTFVLPGNPNTGGRVRKVSGSVDPNAGEEATE